MRLFLLRDKNTENVYVIVPEF